MDVLDERDTGIARGVLGDHRFGVRLDAVRRYCGAGVPRGTFLAVLDKLDLGRLTIVMRTDGTFEVRPGNLTAKQPQRGQARS